MLKQSHKLDLILKGLYKYKHDGKYYSLVEILKGYEIETTPNEVQQLGLKLKKDGFIDAIGGGNGMSGEINTNGIEYVEDNSYSKTGSSIINNHYNISITDSPNSNIVNQSAHINISQEYKNIEETINQIKEIINEDESIDPNLLQEIFECLSEIEHGIKTGNKPKNAIRSLLAIASEISTISGFLTTLGQYAGLIPPLPI